VVIKKSPQQIAKMARAGAILVDTLDAIERAIAPGVSTGQLDQLAERFIRERGATPTFKGYRGFPGSICASPNAMIVHGIPGPYRLKPGDIVSIDVGVTLGGWVADAARTFAVGEVGAATQNLLGATERALHAGVAQCVPGKRMGDLSNAIQSVAEGAGLYLDYSKNRITEETVKGRVKNILSKLGANDRTHAAMIGLKRGIIEL